MILKFIFLIYIPILFIYIAPHYYLHVLNSLNLSSLVNRRTKLDIRFLRKLINNIIDLSELLSQNVNVKVSLIKSQPLFLDSQPITYARRLSKNDTNCEREPSLYLS